jgi:aryl-alcohol dehydrogenase-like predicted oxidoreductase
MKLTRRDLIRLGAGASVAGMAGPWNSLLASSESLVMTTIPSTGERVPAVGIGTNRYRGDVNSADMAPFRATLEAFFKHGGRVIDTSPNYGNSEEVLGRLLADSGLRGNSFMATKVDREDREDGLERMAGSAKRLGGVIDLMQVHNLRGTDVQLASMMEMKAAGKIRYIGITTHRTDMHGEIEDVMNRYPLDFIQINYSLADRAAADRLLPLSMDKGVAVMINRPFGNGKLFSAVKGVDLPGWAAEIDASSWGQLFLKYILSHPAATLPIPGTTKAHHVEDNLQAMRGRLPDNEMSKKIENWFDGVVS